MGKKKTGFIRSEFANACGHARRFVPLDTVRHNQLQKPLLFQPSFPPIVKYSVITFAAASHPLHKATK